MRLLAVGIAAAFAVSLATTALVLGRLDGDPAPSENPGDFVSHVVQQIVSDDYADAWKTLYPHHQAVAASDEYVSCEMLTPVGWKLRSVSVVRVRDRTLRVPGDDATSHVKAVTLRLRLSNAALGAKDVFTHTFNTVAVGSHWTWILTPSRYELYRDNACGAGYSPSS